MIFAEIVAKNGKIFRCVQTPGSSRIMGIRAICPAHLKHEVWRVTLWWCRHEQSLPIMVGFELIDVNVSWKCASSSVYSANWFEWLVSYMCVLVYWVWKWIIYWSGYDWQSEGPDRATDLSFYSTPVKHWVSSLCGIPPPERLERTIATIDARARGRRPRERRPESICRRNLPSLVGRMSLGWGLELYSGGRLCWNFAAVQMKFCWIVSRHLFQPITQYASPGFWEVSVRSTVLHPLLNRSNLIQRYMACIRVPVQIPSLMLILTSAWGTFLVYKN